MKKYSTLRLIALFHLILLYATAYTQDYEYYLGGDNSSNIIITTSSDLEKDGWDGNIASGDKTMGQGLDGRKMECSRFLAQSTLGYSTKEIDQLVNTSFETWIEQQFETPKTNYLATLDDVYAEVYEIFLADGNSADDFRCRPVWYRTNYAWWQMIMTGEDLLRQRIALALSEILVVSMENSNLTNYGYGIASYYDIFVDHAFDNYYDILESVALHPVMGEYLSHRNNPKSEPEQHIFPDENFAREIMQLFSIGLMELNTDGTPILDDEGNIIPTYTNEDITEMAKVFTGLGAGDVSSCSDGFLPGFGLRLSRTDLTTPMVMYDDYHELGEKHLMNNFTIPADQKGIKDVKDAVHFLVNHNNTGPFLAKKMIKLLIKSNPSPAYIQRVASVFNDNGAGVKGDMKAFVKAIFLDEEARNCSFVKDPLNGKLKEPILRFTQYAKAMDHIVPEGRYWNRGSRIYESTGQHPMFSPSVFNFFDPEYIPNGKIADHNRVAPEFQILNTITALEYYNMVDYWTERQTLFFNYEPLEYYDRTVFVDIYKIMNNARSSEVLINKLDVMFTHGQLSEETRGLMRRTLNDYNAPGVSELQYKTMMALFFIMVSPDYLIEK